MRRVEEWVGKTPDTALPRSVFLRIFRGQEGQCKKCGRKLRPGHIEREHVRPLSMGGENRESNIQLWCRVPCSREKTKEEAAPRAKADRALAKRLGAEAPSKSRKPAFPGSKASKWKRAYNKKTGRFETVLR